MSVFSENPVPSKCHLSQSASFCQDPGIPSVDFQKTVFSVARLVCNGVFFFFNTV